ncbi:MULTISPECIES: GlxA family transcriptional regulator [unclassified Serratia (in: enterobacteria)]|uniref:GlxA family transcriptional regulator n=1 Tax=unclassified Serratia (in: enterobacteria) TaxID=2647522 RepID=UPI002ED428DB|nr:helix-turn-helix domain-containing protein [Serratia sp. C2(2)]MEE4448116.1 helix-turn-helix domain-containing protein [Serratia sp. C2(1)]
MKIGIVVFDGIIPFHLSVPFAVFEKVLTPEGTPLCELTICAAEPGELKTNAGFSIVVNLGLSALSGMDMVIVPSWDNPARQPEPSLLDALRNAHAGGATLVGLCMGAFVLASAGLLHHRQATTHWRWLPDFQRCYPAVHTANDVLYLDEGDVVTSAGTAASIDCCLHLVRKYWGADMAIQVAQQLVVPPHRQGGQAQYVELPVQNTRQGDNFFLALAWAMANLHQGLSLDDVAKKACMSRRSFTRRFQQTTGTSFSPWVLNQRLIAAQRLLEKSDCSVETIAEKVGFPSTTSLRRHFLKHLKTSPSRYRHKLRGNKFSTSHPV